MKNVETVQFQVKERVATIQLNRPEVLNAMDEQLLKEFLATLKEVRRSEADIVVISGSGRGFSAGGDIKSMLSSLNQDQFEEIMETISELVYTLYSLPKITISAVHGPAAGLGFSIALACDYLVAHAQSKLVMNFIGIGLIPDGGGHYFLDKRLGEVKAKQLIWSGKPLNGEEAYELGLVDELITDEDFQTAVEKKAADLLKQPIKAIIETKKIYTDLNCSQLKQILALEKESQFYMRQTADHQEGVKAFMDKREPQFNGK
ncbi:enoyl-CoA hydratase [Bacillus sp. IB182487]|uniref:Enoyl-CoA hydratase n=2 Tax=Metabacillus arenae TaxID=2771434 RepID=A0A926RZQ0_9BACI|nr:enoyl-CoA hydratase [Metabacillus arenae]